MSGGRLGTALAVALLACAVQSMPKGTNKHKRQAQEHSVSSVSQGRQICDHVFVSFCLDFLTCLDRTVGLDASCGFTQTN